jgi:flagellar protein FlgJ
MNLQSSSMLSGSLPGAATDTAATAADARALAALRNGAIRDPKAAIKETARQFETLFMQQLLKGMRDAQSAMSSGMLTNQGTQLGTDMLDAEYAKKMSGAPGGLADVIARQLERQLGNVTPPAGATAGATPTSAPGAAISVIGPHSSNASHRQLDFVQRHTEAARAAEAQTGIPASFMVAQAAHESGWGQHEIKNTDGSTSFNVFGIKAGPGWTGRVAEVTTTEVIDGAARKVTAKFRAYASYEDAFNDYAKLMKDSPRYSRVVADAGSGAVGAAGFAQGLQRAGYATDPAYADKLTRVINTTLRLQRVMTT